MVQRSELERKSSELRRRRAKDAPPLSWLKSSEDESSARSVINSMSFQMTDCNSLKEVLSHCKGIPRATTAKAITPRLGVHPLEKETRLPFAFSNELYISSPRILYGNKEKEKSETKYFQYPTRSQLTNPRSAYSNALLNSGEKSHLMSKHVDKTYTIESVSTDCLQHSKTENKGGETFTPTYTVVFLGELSVGKSALCRKFFKSGIDCDKKKSEQDFLKRLEITDDDDVHFQGYSGSSASHQLKNTDSHHVYERPVTVEDHCVRLRILDINSEKHRNECGPECGDFEPFLEVGDAYAVTYSIADRGTFQTVIEILSRMTEKHAETLRSFPVILVGNKCDLVRNRQVTKSSAIKLATKHNIKFIETSASLNENVTELFEGLIQQIRLRRSGITSDSSAVSSPLLVETEMDALEGNSTKESKPDRKNSGSRRKRRPKRVFTRRLTEFLTGGTQDKKTVRAKSCQDLTVL